MAKYKNILNVLEKEKIDTLDTMVATSCDSAWNDKSDDIKESLGNQDYSYDDFCETCNSIWLDCEDNTGLTTIADMVADYIIEHNCEPENYSDLL